MMANRISVTAAIVAAGLAGAAVSALATRGGDNLAVLKEITAQSAAATPRPPWPAGDQLGMANTQGEATWRRCAFHMAQVGARIYDLSHLRIDTMPQSPFAPPLHVQAMPTRGLPHTRQAFNGEAGSGGSSQGTFMEALGLFGYLDRAWDGHGDYPASEVRYYGGRAQADVKPEPNGLLARLGIEHVPPIVTSGILLDAQAALGSNRPLAPGTEIGVRDIETMLRAQGLSWRGLLPGDVLYIRTGWAAHWDDADGGRAYYEGAPGLSREAARYLASKAVAVVSLDTPYADPVFGRDRPARSAPSDLPWVVHHENLTQAGILEVQNASLDGLARDRVWLFCTIILPNRDRGVTSSPVRPIAIGVPSG